VPSTPQPGAGGQLPTPQNLQAYQAAQAAYGASNQNQNPNQAGTNQAGNNQSSNSQLNDPMAPEPLTDRDIKRLKDRPS